MPAKKQPNILYIMSDDHASTAISAYGSRLTKAAPTPNIDQIVKGDVDAELPLREFNLHAKPSKYFNRSIQPC